MAWYDRDWEHRTNISLIENGGGTKANWAELFDVYYNCPPMSADAQCQFLYRPAVRYAGGDHDHTYIATVNSLGVIHIRMWDETDKEFSDPVELWDFGTVEDHNGCGIIVLQHQTGALAAHNGKILVVAVEFGVGLYSRRSDVAESISGGWGDPVTVRTAAGSAYCHVTETDDGVIWCWWNETVDTNTSSIQVATLALGADADDDSWSTRYEVCNRGTGWVMYWKPWLDDNETDVHFGINTRPGAGFLQQDIYYAKKVGSLRGTTDGTTANHLIDSGTDFPALGIVAGSFVLNMTDNTHTLITNVADGDLTLYGDTFTSGEEYMIYRYERSDGTLQPMIMDWSNADHTPDLVYNTPGGPTYTFIWDIKTDGSSSPYILFLNTTTIADNTSTDVHRASYSAGWSTEDTGINVSRMQASGNYGHNSGAEFDEGNPDVIFAAAYQSAGITQIRAYEKVSGTWYIADGNNGTTAISEDGLITQGSTGNHYRPIHVLNGAGRFEWLWFYTEQYEQQMEVTSLRFAYPGFNNGKYIGLNKNAQTDFGDLRFTASDGSTLLGDEGQPWIQEKTDSWRALCWIKAGTIPASGGTLSIYAYYGHVDGDRTNDNDQTTMDAVFLVCDHFAGGSLDTDKWTVRAGDVGVSGSDLVLTGTTGTRGLIDQNIANYPAIPQTPSGEGTGAQWIARMKQGSATAYASSLGFRESNDVTDRMLIFGMNVTNQIACYSIDGGASTFSIETAKDVQNYHIWRMTWKANQVKFYWENLTQANKELVLQETITSNVPNENMVLHAWEGATNSETMLIDLIAAFPWTDPMPLIVPSTVGEQGFFRRIMITHV